MGHHYISFRVKLLLRTIYRFLNHIIFELKFKGPYIEVILHNFSAFTQLSNLRILQNQNRLFLLRFRELGCSQALNRDELRYVLLIL
jgi:hypothetical protein